MKINTKIWNTEKSLGFNREDFINRTGIFVTPEYFGMIEDEFIASHKSVDDFLNSYKNPGVVTMPLTGTFKYVLWDDTLSCIGDYCELDTDYNPNIWELINCLANSHTAVKSRVNELQSIINKVSDDLGGIEPKLDTFDKVFLELAEIWRTLNPTQQTMIAKAIAGTHPGN